MIATQRDPSKWTTVILRPTLMWRIKALFRCPEITFCWGEDKYRIVGLDGADYLAIGGIPIDLQGKLK